MSQKVITIDLRSLFDRSGHILMVSNGNCEPRLTNTTVAGAGIIIMIADTTKGIGCLDHVYVNIDEFV